MESKIILDGITFDDVLLIPAYSDLTPDLVDTSTRLTGSISLRIPLVSAPMDTVTEGALAIALAQEGGIGFVHKNLPPELQAREVAKVKRSENGVVVDPMSGSTSSSSEGVSCPTDHFVATHLSIVLLVQTRKSMM